MLRLYPGAHAPQTKPSDPSAQTFGAPATSFVSGSRKNGPPLQVERGGLVAVKRLPPFLSSSSSLSRCFFCWEVAGAQVGDVGMAAGVKALWDALLASKQAFAWQRRRRRQCCRR